MTAGFTLKFSLDGSPGAEGTAALEPDSLSIAPALGEPFFFSLRDITRIAAGDYRIELDVGKSRLSLSDLGYKYEDFVRELRHMRNELALKDMLMEEKLLMGGVRGDFSCSSGG